VAALVSTPAVVAKSLEGARCLQMSPIVRQFSVCPAKNLLICLVFLETRSGPLYPRLSHHLPDGHTMKGNPGVIAHLPRLVNAEL